ncbi:MAG: glycosyltransferase family 4 protein [Candidatus Sumerlaeota bacterium]|nr:glycosyltransferase family 4 protein [Candidatus Sumerlaeota bacterium]
MKIIIPTTEFPPFPGGVSTVAYEQASGLANLGHKVRVETIDFSKYGPPVAIENAQVNYAPIHARAILRVAPLAAQVWSVCRRERPDFICCPTYRGYGLPVRFAAGAHGIPYSIFIHGTELRSESRRLARRAVMKHVFANAAFLATNSENSKRMLHHLFPEVTTPVSAIVPGVHFDRFQGEEVKRNGQRIRAEWFVRTSAAADSIVLLSTCRLTRDKGIDYVLRALSRIIHEHPDFPAVYVIVGSGPDSGRFKSLAHDLGIPQNVLFAGALAYNDTPSAYHASDVYIQPSQPAGDFLESFGISFIEAQAAGLPCIGSNWGGVPEAVINGETAILVPTGDIDAISDAIMKMVTESEKRRQMSAKAKLNAENFSWELHVAKLATEMENTIYRHKRNNEQN